MASFPTATAFLADPLIARGELDEAAAVLEESGSIREPVATRLALMFNQVLYRRALLRLARGEPELAVEDLLELDERKRRIGDLNPGRYPWLPTLVIALSTSGDGDRARRYADEALTRARRWGTPSSIGIALRARALLEPGSRRIERLRESVRVLSTSPARLEHALALADLGFILESPEAREPLGQALDLADRCGAMVLAERVHKELVASGGRPRRPRSTGARALTPSERRIAEMAASGLSNPEIGQSLFLTRKTVESHLLSVYRKLGIHSRAELEKQLG
jgi:DNA-binding NarL/FixJ family response regulator